MSAPDLTLIPANVVQALKDCADLAALTPRDEEGAEKFDDGGISQSAIVDLNDGNLEDLVAGAVARCAVCVSVHLRTADDDESQSVTPFFNPVKVAVDIYEHVETNRLTPTSDPAGGGTGIKAWTLAALVVKALKLYRLTMLSTPYELEAEKPTIADVTSEGNEKAGVKVLRVMFRTKAASAGRGDGVLSLSPSTGLLSTGAAAGPFSPGSKTYTVTNDGDDALAWLVTCDAAWLTLSLTGGSLAAEATADVVATINDAALALAEGAYVATLTFRNATNAQVFTRAVGLVVGTSGDSMTRKTGEYAISLNNSTFDIDFDEAFTDVPAFADVNIIPPVGQPAIGVRKITRLAAKLTVELDTAAPAEGYVANWFAFLT